MFGKVTVWKGDIVLKEPKLKEEILGESIEIKSESIDEGKKSVVPIFHIVWDFKK